MVSLSPAVHLLLLLFTSFASVCYKSSGLFRILFLAVPKFSTFNITLPSFILNKNDIFLRLFYTNKHLKDFVENGSSFVKHKLVKLSFIKVHTSRHSKQRKKINISVQQISRKFVGSHICMSYFYSAHTLFTVIHLHSKCVK